MGNANNHEFDAFGPWIYEIDEINTLPRLFSDFEYLQKNALLIFKIPRKIDRRVANPNMHLYDMVVAVFKRELIVLSRDGDDVKKIKVAFSDVLCINRTECILDGSIDIFIKGDVISFDYNTISAPIIMLFLKLIRSLQRRSKKTLSFQPIKYNSTILDMPYFTLIERIRADEPEFELAAFQPSIKNPESSKWLKRIKRIFAEDSFAAAEVISCSSAFISNKKELICIGRSSLQNDEGSSDYSYTYTYLPIDSIRRASIELYSKTPFLERFVIQSISQEFSFIIDDSNTRIGELKRSLSYPYV